MRKVTELTLLRLGYLFLFITALFGCIWFMQIKSEADTQYREFDTLLKCTLPANACGSLVAFNLQLETEEGLLLAAKRGFKAEMRLPWPEPWRIGAYLEIISRYSDTIDDSVRTMNLSRSVVT